MPTTMTPDQAAEHVERLPQQLDATARALLRMLVSGIAAGGNKALKASRVEIYPDGDYLWQVTFANAYGKEVYAGIEIVHAEDGEGPENGDGVNFRMTVKREGGNDLNLITVGNYSEECWVPASDQRLIDRRWHDFTRGVRDSTGYNVGLITAELER